MRGSQGYGESPVRVPGVALISVQKVQASEAGLTVRLVCRLSRERCLISIHMSPYPPDGCKIRSGSLLALREMGYISRILTRYVSKPGLPVHWNTRPRLRGRGSLTPVFEISREAG